MPTNDLVDFMANATRDMGAEYERIRKKAAADPGTAGEQGEENWAALLRNWLPPFYHVVTRGRIMNHEGRASPQVDILVLDPAYPKSLLDKKDYLAGGVVAAFECKLTLTAAHVTETLKNAAAIRRLLPKRTGTPFKELHSPIIYGLFAHSHSWKGKGSNPIENIIAPLHAALGRITEHPSEMLDLLCVADLATWVAIKVSYKGPAKTHEFTRIVPTVGEGGAVKTSYVCHSHQQEEQLEWFEPVGTMLCVLLRRLAWENPAVRRIADYFMLSEVKGTGKGQVAVWEPTVMYSPDVLACLQKGGASSGRAWDEWSLSFP